MCDSKSSAVKDLPRCKSDGGRGKVPLVGVTGLGSRVFADALTLLLAPLARALRCNEVDSLSTCPSLCLAATGAAVELEAMTSSSSADASGISSMIALP